MVNKKPPKIRFRPSLFWDVNPKTINVKRHARYIIERILDLGNEKEVRWLMHQYPPGLIKNVLRIPRAQIHDKSKALWSLLFR